jgi:hypothetical protein
MPRLKPEDLSPVAPSVQATPAKSFADTDSFKPAAASTFDSPAPQIDNSNSFNNSNSFDNSNRFNNNSNSSGFAKPPPRADMSNNLGDADVLVKNTNEDWINKKWRPAMGWVYMATCTFDFVIFPILWSLLQAMTHGNVTSQWQPLTLQGAGLYHIAMGAVLGIAAFGRTKEKVAGAN